jgi:hypothetical protein
LRPAAARDLSPFWRARGYAAAPALTMTMRWKEVGEREESDHPMQFWMKRLSSVEEAEPPGRFPQI